MIKVSALVEIPIHYDRFKPEDYGQPGHPHAVYMTQQMATKLEACVEEIFTRSPADFGAPKYILTGGAFVQKPGYHGLGRAFDLDGLIWENESWVANTFPSYPQLYLALESIARKHFGTILTYSYNDPHKDHMHLDDGSNLGFERMSRSRVIYLQNALYYVYGISVSRDGVWGPATQSASNMIREELGIGGFSDLANWFEFLDVTATRSFDLVLAANAVA